MKFFRWSIFVVLAFPVALLALVRRSQSRSKVVDEAECPSESNESQLPSNVIEPRSLL
jgi:hypothetical protein